MVFTFLCKLSMSLPSAEITDNTKFKIVGAMVFLEFEKPLESLYEQLEKIQQVGSEGDLDVSEMVSELELKI